MYIKEIESLLEEGYAEEVQENEIAWFLPHHGVAHPRKPGKVRVVFDCRSRMKGVGLNGVIYSGPNVINSLVDILLRLCLHKNFGVGDVEAMFMRIEMSHADRRYFGFMHWLLGTPKVEKNIRYFVMTRHIFGATSSPFVACESLKRVVVRSEEEEKKLCTESVYVDDTIIAMDDGGQVTNLLLF